MPKTQSRPQRWEAAVERAKALYAEAEEIRERLLEKLAEVGDELSELGSIQEEYQEWFDSLPEGLTDSPTAELLQEIIDLDLNPDIMEFEEVGDAIGNAEAVTLPRGFGRD